MFREITDDEEEPTTSAVPEDTTVDTAAPSEIETPQNAQNGVVEEAEERTPIVEASSLPAKTPIFEAVNYPTIPQLSEAAMTSSYTSTVAPPRYESITKGYLEKNISINHEPQVADAPPLYPSLSKLHYEKDKHGLLTEQNLLAFYHNPLYMASDEFVDRFVQNNLISAGPLFPLLKRLKRLSEQMGISEVSEKENTENLTKCLRDSWVMQQQTFETKGKCGENRDASGTGRFHKAVLCMPKVEELKNLLAANRTHMLDERICQESQFRSTALQVQWLIISINQQFMEENGLSLQSPPTLRGLVLVLDTAAPSNGRILLLNALSDIFFHMRFPALSKRFLDALVGWARELVCVLNMSCQCEDAQFVLNHLLRLPSPISEWAGPFVQTFIQAPTPPKVKVDYCITMLSHLMNPVTAQPLFSAVDKGDQFVALVAFQLLLMKVTLLIVVFGCILTKFEILDSGLSTYCAPAYKQFCKQIGNNLRLVSSTSLVLYFAQIYNFL
ncbi:unnamed protein product [Cylicostephanus goldi]|uniref:Uncharacterized protein n=1 Tax=Cylicostephanus goldi TaxID=71465 RepID=A0A3P7MEQ9_CYLGO|nr:unnamed protein product [Cylicostephanus goldi]